MDGFALFCIFLIPLSVLAFYKIIALAADNQVEKLPKFKIETMADGSGPYYFVYRHLGFPAGWSITPSYTSQSFEECEKWVERAKTIRENIVYR